MEITDSDWKQVKNDIATLSTLVEGNPKLGVVGLRDRVSLLQKSLDQLTKDWTRLKWIALGISIGMLVGQAGILGILVRLLAVISEGAP